MFKRRLKNKLVGEYIEICQIEDYCKRSKENQLAVNIALKAKLLKQKYEQILFKIGCIDLSFYILKKELKNNSFGEVAIEKINNLDSKINLFEQELAQKMKKLLFNEFEITFIESNIK